MATCRPLGRWFLTSTIWWANKRKMTKIFQQYFSDGTSIWCHIQNENYVLGTFGKGQSSAIYNQLKTQEDIQDYIQENGLCPNDFCQGGYIDEGWGEKRMCQYCNIV